MKKLALILIIGLLVAPIVLAQDFMGGAQGFLSVLFNKSEDTAMLALMFWVVSFFLVFKGVEIVFQDNPKAVMIISLLVSVVSIYFLPQEYLDNIGVFYQWILLAVVLLLPYFIGSVLGDLMGLGRMGKIILIALLYLAGLYGLGYMSGIDFGSDILNWFADQLGIFTWLKWVLLAALVWLLSKWLFKGGVAYQRPPRRQREPRARRQWNLPKIKLPKFKRKEKVYDAKYDAEPLPPSRQITADAGKQKQRQERQAEKQRRKEEKRRRKQEAKQRRIEQQKHAPVPAKRNLFGAFGRRRSRKYSDTPAQIEDTRARRQQQKRLAAAEKRKQIEDQRDADQEKRSFLKRMFKRRKRTAAPAIEDRRQDYIKERGVVPVGEVREHKSFLSRFRKPSFGGKVQLKKLMTRYQELDSRIVHECTSQGDTSSHKYQKLTHQLGVVRQKIQNLRRKGKR